MLSGGVERSEAIGYVTTWWQRWDLLPKADVACRQIHVQHDDERHKATGEGGGEQLSASRIGGNGEYLEGRDQLAPGATEDTARTTAHVDVPTGTAEG